MDLDIAAQKAAMKRAVHGLLSAMKTAPKPGIDTATKRSLPALAEIIAVGRTPVDRLKQDGEVIFDPNPESNTRLPQQLAQIARGSARLEGRDTVNDADIVVAQRVAFDTLLPVRRAVLQTVARSQRVFGSGDYSPVDGEPGITRPDGAWA